MDLGEFSKINLDRANDWHGSQMGIGEWSHSDWATALMGEIGEACNLIKKFNRLREETNSNNPEGFDIQKLGDELADAFMYLDLLASRSGFSIEDLVIRKFNAVSEREKLPHRIGTQIHRGEVQLPKPGSVWYGGYHEAWIILGKHYEDKRGTIQARNKDHAPTEIEILAIAYLCDEWDYCYAVEARANTSAEIITEQILDHPNAE